MPEDAYRHSFILRSVEDSSNAADKVVVYGELALKEYSGPDVGQSLEDAKVVFLLLDAQFLMDDFIDDLGDGVLVRLLVRAGDYRSDSED